MQYSTFVAGLSFALSFVPLVGHSAAHAQQPTVLKLDQAIREADKAAYANRGAQAQAKLARSNARLPLKAILPSVRLEAGAMTTTDPIGAFGTLLRQRRVSPEAFQPNRLNYPSAIDNMTGGTVLEVPVLNTDAIQGLQAATRAAEAADARSQWATLTTRLMVVRAYYGVILAKEQRHALGAALTAGNAMTRQIEQMQREGLVTHSDLLQMQVRTNAIQAQLLAAEAGALAARQQLDVLLGRDASSEQRGTNGAYSLADLPDKLPPDSVLKRLAQQLSSPVPEQAASSMVSFARSGSLSGEGSGEGSTVIRSNREDLRAANLDLAAARIDARRANSTLLPRINGIARYDWNSVGGIYAGRPSWTAGLMASWSLFGGASEFADIQGSRARLSAAQTMTEAAQATAKLEADTSARHLQVALAQLDLASQSLAQSREAYRLVQRRYSGGLATIAELLSAEATETAASLSQAAAQYALIEAIAYYRLTHGADPGGIAHQLDITSGN